MTRNAYQKKVLVTGANGFVGSHLVDRLIHGERKVRCLVRRTSDLRYLQNPDIEFVYGGLNEATDWDEALEDVDTIYHVAGKTFARRARDYFLTNHKGTEAILAAAIKHRNQIRRFVLISSLAAAGPGPNGALVNEDTPPNPITAYGKSKLMGEEAARAVSDLLPVTIVRPPAVYGPRDYGIFEFFKMIKGGLFPMIGNYEKRVSLVHARDLAEGIVLAGENAASSGRTYFISSEEAYPMSEVAALIATSLEKRPRRIAIPRALAYAVAMCAEGVSALTRRPPVINRDKVTDLSQACWGCSIERARKELGYHQSVPLAEGIRETTQWYRREGWL
jgi:nucleoside-diphosphate-sugar epimerase